jgi:hypothetical protein
MIDMPYCQKCGRPANPWDNFCQSCGFPTSKQQPMASMPIPPPPPPPPTLQQAPPPPIQAPVGLEQISGFIIATKTKRFSGNEEYYTGILTNHRLIFAPMTKEMLKEVTNITRQQAKSKSTMPPTYPYQQIYYAWGPNTILAQTPDCIIIPNSSIRQISISLADRVSDGYADIVEFEMQILTDTGAEAYRMTKRDEYISRLIEVYRDKVKLPKNYTPTP